MRKRTRVERDLGARPRTLKSRQLEADVKREAEPLFDWALAHGRWYGPPPVRPKTRGECAGGPRPCPWVGCRFHLYLDVKPTGHLRMNFPGVDVEDMSESCALDVADKGRHTLEQVGDLVNLTRRPVLLMEREARAVLWLFFDKERR